MAFAGNVGEQMRDIAKIWFFGANVAVQRNGARKRPRRHWKRHHVAGRASRDQYRVKRTEATMQQSKQKQQGKKEGVSTKERRCWPRWEQLRRKGEAGKSQESRYRQIGSWIVRFGRRSSEVWKVQPGTHTRRMVPRACSRVVGRIGSGSLNAQGTQPSTSTM